MIDVTSLTGGMAIHPRVRYYAMIGNPMLANESPLTSNSGTNFFYNELDFKKAICYYLRSKI